jgi:DNA-binding transcriptional LysR family regulator
VDRFLCIEAFVRVAETKSFTNAAQQLGVCPSVVTSRVRQLEKFVEASLFHRSTRTVALSEAGTAVIEECAELVSRMEMVTEQVRLSHSSPRGPLRIQVLPGFAIGHLGGALADFSAAYPEIELDVVVSDKIINPVEEAVDVTFQLFRPRAEWLIERSLFPVKRVFCASPEYLQKRPRPRHPEDLAGHDLAVYSGYPTRNRWIFLRGKDELTVDLPAKMRSNSVHLLNDFVLSGSGICCLPTLVCGDDLLSGRLVPLLTDYELHPPLELRASYPPTHRGALKVKLLVNFIAQRFANNRPWDHALDEALRRERVLAA